MKIVHLSSERTWRGGEQQIAYLIKGCIDSGIDCHVACKKDSAFETWCIENTIPHVALGFKNELDLLTAFQLKQYCNDNKIDIVHMHSSHSHAIGVLAHFIGNKSKLVLSRRVDFPVKNNLLSRFKFNYKGISKIVCISEAICEVLRPSIKEAKKLTVVHSGIDLNRFTSDMNESGKLRSLLRINNQVKIVANISAIAPHKDYHTFVDVAEKITRLNASTHFVIIGDGPMKEEIEAYIENKNLTKNITLLGFRNDVPDLITDIDVFLMTSKTEGLGTTLLDAFANKIPVVATEAGGIPEVVVNNVTGLTASVGDCDNLANNIQIILNNEELRSSLITNAHRKLISQFTVQSMVAGNLKVYAELL